MWYLYPGDYKGRDAALAPMEGSKSRVCSGAYLPEKFDYNQ